MKTIINVECIDQDMIITNSPVLASGGVHENYIAFKFCSKWDGLGKTAVFYRNEKEKYQSVINTEGLCEIPHEVTASEGIMYFGVFGVLDDATKTTKVLKYKIKQGAMTDALLDSTEPTPNIFEQILNEYQANQTRLDKAEADILELESGVETATNIAKGRNRAHVFTTTEAMKTCLSNADNIGKYQVGDNLYIVEVDVPDWWVSEVLDKADAETGYYYKIAQLETQKVDLTEIEEDIDALNENLGKRQLQTFTDISQIGGSTANTVTELLEMMPAHSVLKTNVTQNTTNLNNSLPNTAVGQLILEKETSKRGSAKFTNYQTGDEFKAIYYNTLGAWEHTTTNSDLANYLPLSGGTMTGSIGFNNGGIVNTDGNIYMPEFGAWLSQILATLHVCMPIDRRMMLEDFDTDPATALSTSANFNYLIYDYGTNNFAGIAGTSQGDILFRTGVGSTHQFRMTNYGSITIDGKTVATTDDLANYIPKSGGTVNGDLFHTGRIMYSGYGIGADSSAFGNAPFVSQANLNYSSYLRAGYGFHNEGVNGAFFYLDTNGSYLSVNNEGYYKKIMDSTHFTVSNGVLTINLD